MLFRPNLHVKLHSPHTIQPRQKTISFQIIQKNAENMNLMEALDRIGSNSKTKKNINETNMLQVSLT